MFGVCAPDVRVVYVEEVGVFAGEFCFFPEDEDSGPFKLFGGFGFDSAFCRGDVDAAAGGVPDDFPAGLFLFGCEFGFWYSPEAVSFLAEVAVWVCAACPAVRIGAASARCYFFKQCHRVSSGVF